MECVCFTEQDTVEFGKKLAHMCEKGDIFALIGTLGMGKSTLSRAIIRELTEAEEVPSPTFTLVQTYSAADFELYHFDLYRLKSPEEIFEIGMEEALYEGVCLIEWPEKMGSYLPENVFKIEITPKETGRLIRLTSPDKQKQERLKIFENSCDMC